MAPILASALGGGADLALAGGRYNTHGSPTLLYVARNLSAAVPETGLICAGIGLDGFTVLLFGPRDHDTTRHDTVSTAI